MNVIEIPNRDEMRDVVAQLCGGKILAADESQPTVSKRLGSVGIEVTPANIEAYRELLFTTPGLAAHVKGVILFKETFGQVIANQPMGSYLRSLGLIPGIKADQGLWDVPTLPGQKVMKIPQDPEKWLGTYAEQHAGFAKARALFNVGERHYYVLQANAVAFVRYVVACHSLGLVPIVEPEVNYVGGHSLEEAASFTAWVLKGIFSMLIQANVELPLVILKTSMVLAGDDCDEEMSAPEEVGEATLSVLSASVPCQLGGIVFLSGGQDDEQILRNLAAVKREQLDGSHTTPWPLSTSFSRAAHGIVPGVWMGSDSMVNGAQEVFLGRLRRIDEAMEGTYTDPTG